MNEPHQIKVGDRVFIKKTVDHNSVIAFGVNREVTFSRIVESIKGDLLLLDTPASVWINHVVKVEDAK